MSLSQALKLARVELAGISSGRQKVQRLGQIVRLFASEVAGTVALAPFALKASQLHAALRPHPPPAGEAAADQDVCLVKGIHYGSKPRNTLDLYVPADATAGQPVPVVLFVHGGVWAAGEAWHYAPLGASLARLGVMACVVQYSLYPDALVPTMVAEVAAAFDWALENVAAYGGDARQVSLVGHSAGAQLCMMALLQRAQAVHEATAAAAAAAGGPQQEQQQQQQQQQQQRTCLRMPRQFVGVTGVYDIAKHYAYEKGRGVHSLSTMLPAVGGFERFAANSPSVILAAALLRQQQQQQQGEATKLQQLQQHGGLDGQQQQQQQQEEEPPACSFYGSFPLSGESVSHRVGFERGSPHCLAAEAGLGLQSLAGMRGVPQLPLEAAAHLPPVVLMSSCSDLTVPWYESAELYWRLYDCGVPVKHLVYNKVGHGEFVTEWPARFDGDSAAAQQVPGPGAAPPAPRDKRLRVQRTQWLQQLQPYCRDLAAVVQGEVPVNFVSKARGDPAAAAGRAAAAAAVSVAGLSGSGLAQAGDNAAAGEADAEVVLQAADLN